MSRIGRLPIPVPGGVDVAIDGQTVSVKGPKGSLAHTVAAPITVDRAEDGTLSVQRPDDERSSRASAMRRDPVLAWMKRPPPMYIPTCVVRPPYPKVRMSPGSRRLTSRGTSWPTRACSFAVRGRRTSRRRIRNWRKPLQSKPRSGEVPPSAYRTPICLRASATTESRRASTALAASPRGALSPRRNSRSLGKLSCARAALGRARTRPRAMANSALPRRDGKADVGERG